MTIKTANIFMLIFFLSFAWLIFADLSDNYLWNDEASTAIFARNILTFGYPRSFDGLNRQYPDASGFNLPGTFVWIADPWVQFYIISASFRLFGINTWSARLPFAVAGFLSLILLFFFCLRYLKSREIGFISVLLLGTSVPFLLHIREGRYYGMVLILYLIIFYLYHRIVEKNKGYFWLSLSFIILSLTNHASFVPAFAGICLIALLIDGNLVDWRRFVIASLFPLVCFAGWLMFSWTGMSDVSSFPVNTSLPQIKKNLEFQVRTINGYFFPLVFWIAVMLFVGIIKKHVTFNLSDRKKNIFKRIFVILSCNMVFFSIFGLRTMRYYIHYLPFLFMLEAFLIYRIFKRKKIIAITIVLLIIFTNLLGKFNPAKFRSYFLDYLYEITHEYTGPLEALCDYLDVHAKPGDRIKIVKGDLTVMFYHPELVILNDHRYFIKSYPEWIVVRRYWNPIFEGIWRQNPEVQIEEGYMDVLDRYEKIALPAVDSIRENVPDNLNEHFFKQPEITPENQMFVYRLK